MGSSTVCQPVESIVTFLQRQAFRSLEKDWNSITRGYCFETPEALMRNFNPEDETKRGSGKSDLEAK